MRTLKTGRGDSTSQKFRTVGCMLGVQVKLKQIRRCFVKWDPLLNYLQVIETKLIQKKSGTEIVNNIRRTRHSLIRIPIVVVIGTMLHVYQAGTTAAPPVAKNETQSKNLPAQEAIVEKPTLPFLTLMLVRDPAVHAELSLDPAQISKVRAAIANVDQPLWLLRDVPIEKSAATAGALLDQLRNQLKRDLQKPQLERLDQLIWQARGTRALVAPEMVQRLKLSTTQVTQLKKVITEISAAREQPQGNAPQSQKSAKEQNQSELRRVASVLTAKQSTALAALLGKPFDLGCILQIGCVAPEIRRVETWINSEPLTLQQLRGKVVVVHFWAFGCINCVRNLPHYQSWHEKFSDSGVTIIGLQTPETEAERNVDNLRRNVRERQIAYPVAFDLNSENWQAWANNMWPSVYLIDKRGQVRYWWYGELNWQGGRGEELMRKRIEQLVAEPD